ncbi:hypothetical protein HYQ46_003332 [Verticillium longisporum]|nr:hypothetical protein HYQ46_003332 [Verticillium longisporum]
MRVWVSCSVEVDLSESSLILRRRSSASLERDVYSFSFLERSFSSAVMVDSRSASLSSSSALRDSIWPWLPPEMAETTLPILL